MKYCQLFISLFILSCVLSVDESKFKKCNQSGFCQRHRSKPTKLFYVIDPATVSVTENRVSCDLISSKVQPSNLELVATVLPNDLIRVKIVEKTPYEGRVRFEATDVLMPEYSSDLKLSVVEKDEKHIVIQSMNAHSRLVIEFNPIHFSYYVDNELKITINDKNLFYFEVTRKKILNDTPATTQATEPEKKHEKKIVDYTEGGHAIYEDGTIEVPEETSDLHDETLEEPVEPVEPVEDTLEEPVEPVEPATETATETATEPATEPAEPVNDDKEDETGYWEEYFGGKTDKKPWGPQSVGADITFHDVDALYGIPQHSSATKLQPTVNGHFPDPYRLFNLDVFEYATDKNTALYGSIPFMLGHSIKHTVGLLWLNPTDTFIDVYNEENHNQATQWMFEAGVFDLFFFPGGSPADLLSQYTQLTSKPYLPPFFSLGYHQSRWNYLDENDVLTVSNKFEELNFPYDVIWLDIEHTDGKKYFTWDKNNFPHPKEMIEKLASHGHKLVTIVDPHVKKESGYRINDELRKLDYFVKTSDGSIYDGWCWPGTSNYPDYTNPAVRAWWGDQFNEEKYEGSIADLYTWNDMNEPSVFDGPEVTMPRDCVGLDGHEHREWHNIYGYYYHNACYEGQKKRTPSQRPFVLTRSFFVGSQRNGPMWTGDIFANWDHLSYVLPMMLTLSLTGISFTGSDVPGFFKDPTEELAIRWYQFGAWMPFFRAHAHIDTKRREPWMFTPETFTLLRQAVMDRYSYLPYIYTSFWQAHTTGLSMVRPLVLAYPQEIGGFDEDHAFLFGDAMFIAPIVTEGATSIEVYVPKGRWISTYDYSIIEGGSKQVLPAPLSHIPVYQREGSVVVRQMRLRRSASQMKHDPYTLYIFENTNGYASGSIYEDERDGFDYEKGMFAYMNVELNNHTIKSKKMEGQFTTTNTIERIVVYTTYQPTRAFVKIGSDSYEIDVLYDQTKNILTLRKPDVPLTSDWTIVME